MGRLPPGTEIFWLSCLFWHDELAYRCLRRIYLNVCRIALRLHIASRATFGNLGNVAGKTREADAICTWKTGRARGTRLLSLSAKKRKRETRRHIRSQRDEIGRSSIAQLRWLARSDSRSHGRFSLIEPVSSGLSNPAAGFRAVVREVEFHHRADEPVEGTGSPRLEGKANRDVCVCACVRRLRTCRKITGNDANRRAARVYK